MQSASRELKKFGCDKLQEEPSSLYGQLLMNKIKQQKNMFKEIKPLYLLDAPNVSTESEYQLLDWSETNVVCLALKGKLFVRNFKTGTTQLLASLPTGVYTSVCQQEELISYCTSNGELFISSMELKQQLQFYKISGIVRAQTFKDNLLCCASKNGILYFDLRQNKCAYQIGNIMDVYTVCLNDTILATGQVDKVCIWDLRNPSILMQKFNQCGKALSWENRRRHYLCAGGKDERITIWNTQGDSSEQYIYTDGPITQLISSNEQVVYCTGNRCYSGNLIMNKHTDKVLRIALSPNQSELCSLGSDELLIFWSLK